MQRKSKKLKSLFSTGLKKKLIVTISTIMSVFVVMAVVVASTTVGLNVSTDGNLTVTGTTTANGNTTLGDASTDLVTVNATGNFVNQLQATSTALFTGEVTMYDNAKLGDASTDNLTVVASSTFNNLARFVGPLQASSTVLLTSGFTSYGAFTVTSTATSTLGGTYELSKTGATSTLQIGSNRNGVGQGGCIALKDTAGAGFLYIYYDSSKNASLQFATTTVSKACY